MDTDTSYPNKGIDFELTTDFLTKLKSDITPGNWTYDTNRDTHDSMVYLKDCKLPITLGDEKFNYEQDYYSTEYGGIIGSSEWLWYKKSDIVAISLVPQLIAEVLRLRNLCHS